ncbi:hypothetical protein RUM44_011950 [Polyplax serrata]|uniref:Uncharacterized protein n=1 Tax=Polyplax serrata TaxID=468196 RepID=A0ABR1BBU2_POLSC
MAGTTVKGADEEVEVDIDELLDMDSDDQRRKHLEVVLADAKKSRNDVQVSYSDFDGQVASRDFMRDPKKDHWYWVGTECESGAVLFCE